MNKDHFRALVTRTCEQCGNPFQGTCRARFCPPCMEARKRARSRAYNQLRKQRFGMTTAEKAALEPYIRRRLHGSADATRDRILYIKPQMQYDGSVCLVEHRGMFPSWLAHR